jgi:hypothetical protein
LPRIGVVVRLIEKAETFEICVPMSKIVPTGTYERIVAFILFCLLYYRLLARVIQSKFEHFCIQSMRIIVKPLETNKTG